MTQALLYFINLEFFENLPVMCVCLCGCECVCPTSGNAQKLFAFLREQSAVKVELFQR